MEHTAAVTSSEAASLPTGAAVATSGRSRRSEGASRRRDGVTHHQRPVTLHPSPPDLWQSPVSAARSLQSAPNRVSRRSYHPGPSPDILHGRLNATVRMRRATQHPKRNRRAKRLEIQEPGVAKRFRLRAGGTPSPHPRWRPRVARCGLTSRQVAHEAGLDTLGRVRPRPSHLRAQRECAGIRISRPRRRA